MRTTEPVALAGTLSPGAPIPWDPTYAWDLGDDGFQLAQPYATEWRHAHRFLDDPLVELESREVVDQLRPQGTALGLLLNGPDGPPLQVDAVNARREDAGRGLEVLAMLLGTEGVRPKVERRAHLSWRDRRIGVWRAATRSRKVRQFLENVGGDEEIVLVSCTGGTLREGWVRKNGRTDISAPPPTRRRRTDHPDRPGRLYLLPLAHLEEVLQADDVSTERISEWLEQTLEHLP